MSVKSSAPVTPQSPAESPTGTTAERIGPNECLVVFIEPNGRRRSVAVLHGQNLMDAALTAGVEGIKGQCGGAINCATCLCDIELNQLSLLPAQHPDEAELLNYVDEASKNSRLACQLYGRDSLNGLVAQVVLSIASPAD